jgi:hypothetical protein
MACACKAVNQQLKARDERNARQSRLGSGAKTGMMSHEIKRMTQRLPLADLACFARSPSYNR